MCAINRRKINKLTSFLKIYFIKKLQNLKIYFTENLQNLNF